MLLLRCRGLLMGVGRAGVELKKAGGGVGGEGT